MKLTRERIAALAALLVLVVAGVASVWSLSPPPVAPASAPPEVFSAERALADVRVIARVPHTTGTPANDEARAYILAQLQAAGLEVSEQDAPALTVVGTQVQAGRPRNVMGRLRGDGTRQGAILLAAHYDAAGASPGAADDAAGVAALLETLRALRARGKPLARDVIFLFTDGEEAGLLGAQSFVAAHPWAKDAVAAVNFEARGVRGPSIMFEAAGASGALIEALDDSDARTIASSFVEPLYRLTPHNTDMHYFAQAGIPGLNFAFAEGFPLYHTQRDDVANLSPESLQHHGDNALALVLALAGAELPSPAGPQIFFNPIGRVFVHYSAALAIPLALIAVVALVVLMVRRRPSAAGATAVAVVGHLVALLLATGVVFGVNVLVQILRQDRSVGGPTAAILAAELAIGIAAWLVVAALLARRLGERPAHHGFLILVAIFALATAFLAPAMSFAFVWPLLFALPLTRVLRDDPGPAEILLGAVLLVPGITVLAGCAALLHTLAPPLTAAPALLIVLATGLAWPLWRALGLRRLRAPALGMAAGLAIAVGAALLAPRPLGGEELVYCLDADSGQSTWLARVEQATAWNAAQLAGAVRTQDTACRPGPSPHWLSAPAPAATLAPPTVTVVEDRTDGGRRHLTLALASQRGASVLTLWIEDGTPLVEASVHGLPIEGWRAGQGPWRIRLHNVAGQSVEMRLVLDGSGRVSGRLVDWTRAADGSGVAMPESGGGLSSVVNGTVHVKKSFAF